jgi:hypothetical protein
LNKSVEYISYEMPIQKMDTLERQPGEKFHDWAKRIQILVIFYDGYCPRLRTQEVVETEIGFLRLKMQIPNLRICVWGCGRLLNLGHSFAEASQVKKWHRKICPRYWLFDQNTKRARVIQKAFRSYMHRKYSKAAKTIQQAVIHWLYKPDGPMMRKAEQHFNQLMVQ